MRPAPFTATLRGLAAPCAHDAIGTSSGCRTRGCRMLRCAVVAMRC